MIIKSLILAIVVGITTITTVVVSSCTKEENIEASSDSFSSDITSADAADLSKCPNCGNCVLYTRCKIPSLPYGLEYYQAKKNIINAYTPAKGYAAIMPAISAKYVLNGHIAYVESVNSDGTITILEGSNGGTCTKRTDTPAKFKIVGYYRP